MKIYIYIYKLQISYMPNSLSAFRDATLLMCQRDDVLGRTYTYLTTCGNRFMLQTTFYNSIKFSYRQITVKWKQNILHFELVMN